MHVLAVWLQVTAQEQTSISLVNYILQHAEEKATPILILLISSVTNTCYCLAGNCFCCSLDLFQRRMRTSRNNFYSQSFDPKVLPISVLQMIESDSWGPHLKHLCVFSYALSWERTEKPIRYCSLKHYYYTALNPSQIFISCSFPCPT